MVLLLLVSGAGNLELNQRDYVGGLHIGVRIDDDNPVHTGLVADLKRKRNRTVLIDDGCSISQRAAVERLNGDRFTGHTQWKLQRHIGICARIYRYRLKCTGAGAVILNNLLRVAVRDLVRLRNRCLAGHDTAAAETDGRR